MNFIKSAALLAAIAIPAAASAFPFTVTKGAKNVVLVHGGAGAIYIRIRKCKP